MIGQVKQVVHLGLTDLRHWRWPVVAWLLLGALQAWIAENPLVVDLPGVAGALTEVLSGLLPVVTVLFFCGLVSLIVHETPLVGTEAFWLTRPIGRAQLLASKLLVLVPLLVLYPELLQVILMVRRGLPAGLISAAALDGSWWRSVYLLVVLVFAAVTPSTLRFLLAAGATVLVAIAGLASMIIVLTRTAVEPHDYWPSIPLPDTSALVQTLALSTVIAAATVWHQFRTRRRGRTIALSLAGLAAIQLWPASMAPAFRAPEPAPPAWAVDETGSALALQSPDIVAIDQPAWGHGSLLRCMIAADLGMSGVPKDYFAEILAERSTFTGTDGATVTGRAGLTVMVPRVAARPSLTYYTAWQKSIGPNISYLRQTAGAPQQHEQWPALAVLQPDVADRLSAQPVAYSGSFEVRLWRYRQAAVFAIGPAVFRDGGHVLEILRAACRQDSCSLVIRQAFASSMLRPRVQPTYTVVIRHRERGEVVTGQPEYRAGHWNVLGVSTGMSVGAPGSTSEFGGFAMHETRVRYPAPAASSASAGWFDNAEIVVVETIYAGRVSRQWSASEVRIARSGAP